MTNKEAICQIQALIGDMQLPSEEALNLAIKALEQTDEDYNYKALWNIFKKERDIAIGQLHELGYEFGEKIRTDEDCISREELYKAIDELKTICGTGTVEKAVTENNISWLKSKIDKLPSVTPKSTYYPEGDLIDRNILGGLVDCHNNVHWEDIEKIPSETLK